MKKILSLIVIVSLLTSCGGGGGEGGGTDNPPTPTVNNKPATPSTTYPSASSLCIDNSVKFEWNAATDPDGDAVKYNLQIALDNQFTQIEHDLKNISGTYKIVTLDKGVAYFWRLKAIDSKNLSGDFSSNVQFYTEGVGVTNYLPFMPELVKPAIEEVVTSSSVTLEWTASDVDNDSLTFDVYFGEDSNSLTLVSENQSETTYTTNVTGTTSYFWKIAVKDGNSGTTIGQVWNFTTD